MRRQDRCGRPRVQGRRGAQREPPPRRRWSFSKLTARVLAINLLALMILVGGLLYLGRYEERLIQAEMDSLRTEALISPARWPRAPSSATRISASTWT